MSDWTTIRNAVLLRDNRTCAHCKGVFPDNELDVHHLIPRSMGGPDEPSNLIALCDGCHGAIHPNLQVSLSRRFIERWAMRLARLLDTMKELPDSTEHLGVALRLLGVSSFRGAQLDVVLAALKGQSVLLVSPTGSGKSLCFQIPTLLRSGTALVFSPLKALMNDQVSGLQSRQIPSTFINGDVGKEEKLARYRLLERNLLKFFYCTPERFDTNLVIEEEIKRLSRIRPSYLVVDEAHCIDRWGSDFRPNYGRLGAIRSALGSPPVLSFTATAGIKTQKKILQTLGIEDARVVVTGVNRPNIALLRVAQPDNWKRLDLILSTRRMVRNGRMMIFVPTIKVGETLRQHLLESGLDVPFYHGSFGDRNDREMLLGQFAGRIKPEVDTIICTNAFGMGIDISNVRVVVHWQHPASVEDYLQEMGRAGRDGKQSVALLFTNRAEDAGLLKFMAEKTVENASLTAEDKRAALQAKLDQIRDIDGIASTKGRCFRRALMSYFGESIDARRKSFAIWLVEWLFGSRTRQPKQGMCCDYCNRVDGNDQLGWVGRVFGIHTRD